MMFFGVIGILLILYVFFKPGILGKKMGKHLETNSDALEVLKKRYAEGEISHEKFIQMRDAIKD